MFLVLAAKGLSGNVGAIGHEEWFSLYCKTLDAFIKIGQVEQAEKLSDAVITTRKFQREPRRQLVGVLSSEGKAILSRAP